MKERELCDISKVFADDIGRYLDAGGDRNDLRASNVYRFLYSIGKEKQGRDIFQTRIALGVRSDNHEPRF